MRRACRRTVLGEVAKVSPVPGQRSITEAEKLAPAKLGGIPVRREQMAVATIHRAASNFVNGIKRLPVEATLA